ncbi:MAG: response regulator [Ignavibacteriales bacterium]|nr:response regulator [Ignavibacteriales bacterium]
MENGKPHILIIDDEKGLRLGAKRLLESEGYVAEAVESGMLGLELAKEKEFDLALIDLKMPDMDGIEVLKEIKKIQPNIVCFMATAYASYETAIESTKLGAYSYIPKPFTPEELLQQLEKGYEKRLLILEAERLKKEREERLLEVAYEKSRLKTIINSITEGVLVVNKTGELVLFNSSAVKFLDLNVLFIGDVILDILPKEIVKLIRKYIESDSFIPNSYSTQIELKPNKELIVEATCSPVPHADGSLAGIVTVIKNITEQKKYEEIKSQFVSMVAHELKAPMAAVIGFIKLILDDSIGVTKEQEVDYLNRSFNRLQGLLAMVNDLLDISRMELKSKQREIKELDVVAVLNSTIEFMEFELKKKNITVNLVTDTSSTKLKADQNEITRLFTNILSNGIKYNKENGSINIIVDRSENYLTIKIADTGIGMISEEKAKLFQEFYRAKNEKTRSISGTGLGLSIVKRIVDSYNGKIKVDSEYGAGTTFVIYFPITQ